MAIKQKRVRETRNDLGGTKADRRRDEPRKLGRPLSDLREEMLASEPSFQAAWDAQEVRRRIVATLVKLRRDAGLTQREVAYRAGWNPAFVSRLESIPPRGREDKISIPNLQTLLSYAAACNSELGLVFGHPEGSDVHISEAVALGHNQSFTRVVDALDDATISVDRDQVKVTAD